MVVCEAEHTCMTCRGVKKTGSKTLSIQALEDASPDSRKREVLFAFKWTFRPIKI